MTDEELVERVRKALYFAKHHGGDDAQAEVAIRGVARMLANNLEQFHRMFVPYEPPIEAMNATQAMGQRIVQLTIERADLLTTVDRLTRQVHDVEKQLALQGRRTVERTPKPKAPKREKRAIEHPRETHQLILDAVGSGCVTEGQIFERTGLGVQNLAARLSEMVNNRHFGGALLKRRTASGIHSYELTDRGRDLLEATERARYQPLDDAGRSEVGSPLYP